MPFYKYNCINCNYSEDKKCLMSLRNSEFHCPNCDSILAREFVSPPSTTVMEMADKYHGKQIRKNIVKILKKRSRDHMIQNVGDYIETHGIETVKKTSLLPNGKKNTVWNEK